MFGPDGDRPSIRAGWTRGLLRYLEEHAEPARVASVLSRIRPESQQAIRALDGLAWLDIAAHLELLESMRTEVGPIEFVSLTRAASLGLMQGGLLRTTAVAGVRVFGRAAILKVLPRGWRLIVRGCGNFRVRRHPELNLTEVALAEMPPIVAASEGAKLATAGMLAASCDLAGLPGRVQVDREGTDATTFVYHVSVHGEPRHRDEVSDRPPPVASEIED